MEITSNTKDRLQKFRFYLIYFLFLKILYLAELDYSKNLNSKILTFIT